MLKIKNLHANVEGKEILKGINLEVNRGEVHAIMGPNGSGKSTLANVLSGNENYEVTSGEILFDGKNMLDLSIEDRAREGLFLAFQYPIEIAGISNAIQVFLDDMDDDSMEKPIFEEMLVQLKRVNQAVNNLLSYSKPQIPKNECVDITRIIERAITLTKQSALRTHVAIHQSVTSKIPPVYVDPKQIEQVLVNIIMNAIQATEKHGKIYVTKTIDESRNEIVVSVTDNGVGISEENMKQIFRPFYTSKHKGTGLGLAICDNIINQHGGRLEVQSREGDGSVFSIVLPLDESTQVSDRC